MSFPCEAGCPELAVVRLGKIGRWSVCATCAELPRFRHYRVAHVIDADVTLRRDSAGWWVAGELVPPAPLAAVLRRIRDRLNAAR